MLASFPSLLVFCFVLLLAGCEQAAPPPERGPLQGAWAITEVAYSSPDTSWTNSDPQPGLYIFLNHQYSTVFVQGGEPRDTLSEASSTEERFAAYDDFIANAGTYDVSDSTLTVKATVAKHPNAMLGGSFSYTYEVEGEILHLFLNAAWVSSNEKIHYTLNRVENIR